MNTVNKDRYSLGLRLTYDYDNYKNNFQFDTRILINFIKLLKFCKENEIGICISSTWRMGTSVEGWNDFLHRHFSNSLRLKKEDKLVIGLTDTEHNGIRGLQILDWLNSCEDRYKQFFIVDDEKIERKIYVNGIYEHFKGNKYKVLNIAEHTETGDKMVVYQALYGENKIYVRPYNMFISKVDIEKYPDVGQEYRFELVED